MSVDGTPISQADIARMEHDEALHSEWQRKAVKVVAASATDVDDCRTLLSMLGLDGDVLVEARRSLAARKAPRRRRATAA
jgi:hypothetical protein